MLKNTFCHVHGITPILEMHLWLQGIKTWEDFLHRKNDTLLKKIPENKKNKLIQGIQKSMESLDRNDYELFKTMPRNQHWRIYEQLRKKTCYLDIETTGLSKEYNEITLIGIHSEEGTKIYMNGKNLHEFKEELEKYEVIVTFNGSCFDIPFIKHKYPELNLNQYHLDLRFLMARLGYRGGLKNIEIAIGINRGEELEGVDGYEAVRLWHAYKKGNQEALKKLEKYLKADVENLKLLMNYTYKELKEKSALNLKTY